MFLIEISENLVKLSTFVLLFKRILNKDINNIYNLPSLQHEKNINSLSKINLQKFVKLDQ